MPTFDEKGKLFEQTVNQLIRQFSKELMEAEELRNRDIHAFERKDQKRKIGELYTRIAEQQTIIITQRDQIEILLGQLNEQTD